MNEKSLSLNIKHLGWYRHRVVWVSNTRGLKNEEGSKRVLEPPSKRRKRVLLFVKNVQSLQFAIQNVYKYKALKRLKTVTL